MVNGVRLGDPFGAYPYVTGEGTAVENEFIPVVFPRVSSTEFPVDAAAYLPGHNIFVTFDESVHGASHRFTIRFATSGLFG